MIILLHLEHFRLLLEYPLQFLASQFREDINKLRKIHQSVMRILRMLKRWHYDERLRNRVCSAWRRANYWRTEQQLSSTCEEVLKKTGCLQCCMAAGWKEIDILILDYTFLQET